MSKSGEKEKWFKNLIFVSRLVPVRVKGGKSLRNGMWHGLRNGIIMRNTRYAE